MKAIYKLILLVITGIFILASCENYLDKAPESGLSETDVFSKYENFMSYFDGIYDGTYYDSGKPTTPETKVYGPFNIKCAYPLFWAIGNQKNTWDAMTDICDMGRIATGHTLKSGSFLQYSFIYTYAGYRPILRAMFMVIRRANMAIEKVDMLANASQADKDDIKGQAYFNRGLANFALLRTWGPMPYLTKVVGPYDNWDQERLTKYQYLVKIAADFDSAAFFFDKANVMRRDNPVEGAPGHLTHPNMFRPNGCAALAFKSRTLLYAASPLNNMGITTQPWDKSDGEGQDAWEKAAKANWDALQTALQNGFKLLTPANYKYNFVGASYTNEHLFAWATGATAYNNGEKSWIINGFMSASKSANSGCCPTQNGVDRFETAWGDPLETEADRQAAAALGHYNEQEPYKDRDPRFYVDIMYNTASIPGYTTAKIYYERLPNGSLKYSEQLDPTYAGRTYTGYYLSKYWGGESTKVKMNVVQTDPLMRLAELYLNYAEAANEAYGPNVSAPGADMTAVEAINVIRARFNQVPVQDRFTLTKDAFRDRIKNERVVELGYEGFHYFYDIRRWMDAPERMTEVNYGMDIEKLPAGYDPAVYPTGYRYTRVPLAPERQGKWKDAMYYFAFDLEDVQKMKNFIPNISW